MRTVLMEFLKPGMVMCVETYVGRYSGGPGVKLEEQVLVTDNGYEIVNELSI